MTNIKVGDWVRFYSNGKLVIGQVEYITGQTELRTDVGTVSDEYVLEVRSDEKELDRLREIEWMYKDLTE